MKATLGKNAFALRMREWENAQTRDGTFSAVACGSIGRLRGKEQFVAAQILLKGIAARERFAQLRSR